MRFKHHTRDCTLSLHELAHDFATDGGLPLGILERLVMRTVDHHGAVDSIFRKKSNRLLNIVREVVGSVLAATEHGVPIRIIPGISAGIGGLAYAGIPGTHRDVNQSVTFVTGHDQSGNTPGSLDWDGIARGSQVIVIYMGIKHMASIAASLMQAGRAADEPVAIVTTATLEAQSVYETTLSEAASRIEADGIEPPAIICVGKSVKMREVLDWQGQMAGIAPRNLDPLGRGRPAESA